MIKLSTSKPEIEVSEVKVVQPQCGSVSLYVNASARIELTINGETFNIEYQNGQSFDYNDYDCPSNCLEYFSVYSSSLQDNLESIKAIAECNPTDIDELANNNAEIAYTAEEVTAIYTAIQERVQEAQMMVDAIEQESEKATETDPHVYLIVSTLNDHFSMRFDDDDEADQFIENASEEEYCSIDRCDAMTACSNYNEHLSNYII